MGNVFNGDFVAATANKKVLVKFQADWCGPCKALKPIFADIANENLIEVIEVDIDEHPDLAAQFGIASIPAVLSLNNGKPIDLRVGAAQKSVYIKMIDDLNSSDS